MTWRPHVAVAGAGDADARLSASRPVVGLETWELSEGGKSLGAIVRAKDAEEAVSLALRLARDRLQSEHGGGAGCARDGRSPEGGA